MQTRTLVLIIAGWLLGVAAPALAQSTAQQALPAHKWSHCTTLAMSGGVATGSDHTGGALTAAIGWELTPRLAVEASGMWFDKQTGSSAYGGGLSLRALLLPSHTTAPFVEGGFGLYAASFRPNVATSIPPFYGDRMTGTGTNWFTDPAFFAAAGIDAYRSNRVAVRPAVGAIVAVRGGDAYVVGTATVRVEYHFGGLPPASARR